MTTTNASNGYTLLTMNSTDVYNYMKRLARKDSNEIIDCHAEAFIATYGDDCNVPHSDVKAVLVGLGCFTVSDFREMECHVVTSMHAVTDRDPI